MDEMKYPSEQHGNNNKNIYTPDPYGAHKVGFDLCNCTKLSGIILTCQS